MRCSSARFWSRQVGRRWLSHPFRTACRRAETTRVERDTDANDPAVPGGRYLSGLHRRSPSADQRDRLGLLRPQSRSGHELAANVAGGRGTLRYAAQRFLDAWRPLLAGQHRRRPRRMFDSQFKNDAIGWDGNYGLTFTTTTAASPFGYKVAVLHISSHLGDEYEERTSLARINYTREELALGLSWRFRPRWRAYGDVGIAYRMRSEGQERWRWQGGVEYEARATVFGGRMAWYGAVDFSAMEERDWRLDTVLQGGLVTWSGGHAYRIFTQWADGRVPLGQFTRTTPRRAFRSA